MTQTTLAILILLTAVLYVARRTMRALSPKKKTCGCSGCGCSGNKKPVASEQEKVISIGQ
jgi:hypothetical protein